MKIVYRILVCCVAVCITAACSSSAHIVVRDNADYSLSTEFIPSSVLEKNIAHLLKQKNDQPDGESVFNAEELKASLSKEGINVQKITLKGAMGLNLACTLPQTHALLKDFISYDKGRKKVLLRISPENVSSFLETIPQESRDFIDMLMAPLFTGDKITSAEYEELIGAAYGKKIAAELRSSEFVLTVDVPYKVETALISPFGTVTLQTKTEKFSRASVRIPLLALLCTTGTIEVQL